MTTPARLPKTTDRMQRDEPNCTAAHVGGSDAAHASETSRHPSASREPKISMRLLLRATTRVSRRRPTTADRSRGICCYSIQRRKKKEYSTMDASTTDHDAGKIEKKKKRGCRAVLSGSVIWNEWTTPARLVAGELTVIATSSPASSPSVNEWMVSRRCRGNDGLQTANVLRTYSATGDWFSVAAFYFPSGSDGNQSCTRCRCDGRPPDVSLLHAFLVIFWFGCTRRSNTILARSEMQTHLCICRSKI